MAFKGHEDEADRWIVTTAGEKHWHIATIENGAPGDILDTEEANARLIAAAPAMLQALKKATSELNAIRARDGAPQHISWDRGRPMQTDGCTHEYFDSLVEECFSAIASAEGKDGAA